VQKLFLRGEKRGRLRKLSVKHAYASDVTSSGGLLSTQGVTGPLLTLDGVNVRGGKTFFIKIPPSVKKYTRGSLLMTEDEGELFLI